MRNNKKKWFYLLLVLLLAITSCKTQKIVKTQQPEKETKRSGLAFNTFHASKATFTLARQQKSINVNGSMRIKKDSIIIFSFQPFLGMEVARVGITQNSFTLVDRMNRRYCTIDFATLKKQLGIDVNYQIFQSIFTNSLFIYNNPNPVSISDFKEVKVGDLSLLQASEGGVNQEFNINEIQQPLSGMLFLDDEPYSIRWNYMLFNALENGYFFPHLIKITASSGKDQNQIDVTYNKIELDKNLNFQFSVPSSYTEVTWEELVQMLR